MLIQLKAYSIGCGYCDLIENKIFPITNNKGPTDMKWYMKSFTVLSQGIGLLQ